MPSLTTNPDLRDLALCAERLEAAVAAEAYPAADRILLEYRQQFDRIAGIPGGLDASSRAALISEASVLLKRMHQAVMCTRSHRAAELKNLSTSRGYQDVRPSGQASWQMEG